MDFEEKIEEFIALNNLFKKGDRVVVGISGGADSVALLLSLKNYGCYCVAVHCNFHLRGEESNRDQSFVESLCRKLAVTLKVFHYDTTGYAEAHKCSVEMAARELRYADFERVRCEQKCVAIAVAHHRDDSVETVLMNLVRGTGIRGLSGIKPVNGFVVRPFLCVSRADIEEWLESQGQTYVTDSTNLSCGYTRNKIRLRLLPIMRELNPDVDNAIFLTSERLAQTFDIYKKCVDEEIAGLVSITAEGTVRIDIEGLMESASAESVLYEILSPYGFNETVIRNILSTLDAGAGRTFESAEYTLVTDRNCLLVKKNIEMLPDGYHCDISVPAEGQSVVGLPDGRKICISVLPGDTRLIRNPEVAMLDSEKTGDKLTLRVWRRGDSFVPLGMRGRKLVSDFLTDCKLSLLQKREQLVLCSGEDIIWIVGRRIDNRYKVTADTGHIVSISVG